MNCNRNNDNEHIVQLLYRRLKGLPLTMQEDREIENWLNHSPSNRNVLQNLSDEEWLKQAKKKYYAAGKEEGLKQLREQLFRDIEMESKPWHKRIFCIIGRKLRGMADAIVPTISDNQIN